MLEKETGFRNVFGHDAVRNPIKSPPGGLLAVTEDNYRQYLAHRRQGLGNQGVGPMQLTSPSLQDRADQLGGCWQPGPNIRVGLEFLAGNIRRLGLRAGVVAYNGSGPAAQRYGDDVLAAARRWDARLRGARPPRPAPDRHDRPRRPRRPRPGRPAADLPPAVAAHARARHRGLPAAAQRALRRWSIDKRLDVDGEYGPMTRRAARQAVYALGIPGTELAHGVTPELRTKLRRPSRRTPDEVAHAARRRGWLGRLRRQHEGRGAQAALAYARKHLGVVESPPATNRGPLIDRWNRATGHRHGEPVVRQLRQRLPDGGGLSQRAVAAAVLGHRGQRQGRQGRLAVDERRRARATSSSSRSAARPTTSASSRPSAATRVVTIEGNTHKDYDPGRFWEGYGVFRRHHPAGQSAIRGYARPPYGR